MSRELFSHYLAMSEETRDHQIAESSSKTYHAYMKSYEKAMREKFEMDPYPLDEKKACAFLMLKKDEGRTYQTLQMFISTFSWFLRHNDLENFVLSISFKAFKNGLRRQMAGGSMPNAKLPFDADFFPRLRDTMNLSVYEDRLLFLLMCLAFHFFMRIGEVLQLRVRDLKVHEEEQLLSIYFVKSKADQYAEGVTSYVPLTGDLTDPVLYMDVLQQKNPDDLVSPWKKGPLVSRLRARLKAIGVEDSQSYSWHSFRRGAAYLASKNGVADCVIKKHGRWASHAYLRYVAVDAIRAGREVREALTT